ncbi:MAG: 3'-5' exonuclease [Oscillospiraceae bacterium]
MIVTPKGTQIDVLALEPKGHNVVLGTAGSGKTTMALLFAEKLSNLDGNPKVLIVTFNRVLVAYINDIKSTHKINIQVENYHSFALGYLNNVGKMGEKVIIKDYEKSSIIEEIVKSAQSKYPDESSFKRPVQTFIDEIQFLERFGVETLEKYKKIERVGRANTYISRENRRFFFYVYEMYKKNREKLGFLYDWDDIATTVYNSLLEDTRTRLYTHIIVDEGQDFSPMMLKSLVNAFGDNGSFTFFGDVAQQIYGHSLSWKQSGINILKKCKFENNYRNPIEIAVFAQDITTHTLWESKGDDEYVNPKFEVPAAGVLPTLVKHNNKNEEIKAIGNLVKGISGKNVIIVKDRATVKTVILYLKQIKVIAIEIKKESNKIATYDGVYVTTFHSAKGLEFDNVFIPYLGYNDFPDSEKLANSENEGNVRSNWLKLFYVAVTRAKQGLVMTYSNKITSLFPVDSKNYILVDKD